MPWSSLLRLARCHVAAYEARRARERAATSSAVTGREVDVIAVLVVWHIRDAEEARAAFLRFWRGRVPIRDRGGLVGEFLCEPVAGIDPRSRTLGLAGPGAGAEGAVFVTVGLWADRPVAWRRGAADLPPSDSEGVA